MATVAIPTNVGEWIDSYISYLEAVLGELHELDREWDDWDEMSKLTYVVEWDIKRDRFHQLEQWAKRDLLTDVQKSQYEALLCLLEQRQPILDRILAD